MRARLHNTPSRAVVALLAALALAAGLSACGGSAPSATVLLRDTFQTHKPIDSGQVNLSFVLAASGYAPLKEPVSLKLSGPFQSTGSRDLPLFALQLQLKTGAHSLQAGATSTGGHFYIELAGTPFEAPASTVAALRSGYAQATKSTTKASSQSTFAALGLEPADWLEHPVKLGEPEIGGARTVHLRAALNATRFLADAGKLSGASSTLGLGSSIGGTGLLSAAAAPALARSISSAHVDVYTGKSDHLLRRLTVTANVLTSTKARAQLDGLRKATLELELQFSDVNHAQKIVAPAHPKPLSELLTELQQLGLVSGVSSAGSSEGTSGASGTNPGSEQPISPAYARCVEQNKQSLQAQQRCAALL